MGILDVFRRHRKYEKRQLAREQESENTRQIFQQILDELAPIPSFPEYRELIEKPTYSIITETLVGNASQVADAIWKKWRFHYNRSGPYGDPESARALEAFRRILDAKEDRCSFPWGVNTQEYRIHRSSSGEYMFVDILCQMR